MGGWGKFHLSAKHFQLFTSVYLVIDALMFLWCYYVSCEEDAVLGAISIVMMLDSRVSCMCAHTLFLSSLSPTTPRGFRYVLKRKRLTLAGRYLRGLLGKRNQYTKNLLVSWDIDIYYMVHQNCPAQWPRNSALNSPVGNLDSATLPSLLFLKLARTASAVCS